MGLANWKAVKTLAEGWQKVSPGCTPYEVVMTENKMRLLRFRAAGKAPGKPVFVVYSVINRYTVLDLLEGKSAVAFLADRGMDVYVVDWGTAGAEDRFHNMDYYVEHLLGRCFRRIQRLTGQKEFPVLGYCLGGTMAACYASLHPEQVSRLVLLAAPFDFSKGGVFTAWTKPGSFPVDAMMDAYGNLPPEAMQSSFWAMNFSAQMNKLDSALQATEKGDFFKFFVALEKWSNDNVPYPGGFYREYIKGWYQDNGLVNRTYRINGQTVDLSNVKCPAMVISATKDTIVPPECATAALGLLGSPDKREISVQAGHIGVSVGGKAFVEVWPKVADFMQE